MPCILSQLNLDGKVPAEEIVPVSTEIKIAQDGFPAGHRLYLVARDTLSKSTAKLLVPQRLPLEELCVPRSLTISPARYIKQEQMSVKVLYIFHAGLACILLLLMAEPKCSCADT